MFKTKKTDNFSRTIKVGRVAQRSCIYTDTTDGRQYVKFSVAVNKDKEKADFFECTAYNAQARYIDRYADVGTKVLLLGSDRIISYMDARGVQHKTTQVIADTVMAYDSEAAQALLEMMNGIFSYSQERRFV